MNKNFNLLEEIINKNKDNEIIFSEDKNNGEKHNSVINSGILIVKNSEYTKKLVKYWLTKECLDKRIDGFNDQGCMRYTHKENIFDLKDNSVILPFGELQTFNVDNYNNSLIVHMAGRDKEKRIKTMDKLKKLYFK